jgi:hypothetical protein
MLDPLAEQIRGATVADPATDAVGDRIRSFVGAPPRASRSS